jgi:hypothetical protein
MPGKHLSSNRQSNAEIALFMLGTMMLLGLVGLMLQ